MSPQKASNDSQLDLVPDSASVRALRSFAPALGATIALALVPQMTGCFNPDTSNAGDTEYGGPPASAVVAQRASGRVWIGAEPGRAKALRRKAGPKRSAEPRRPKSRHAETSPGRTGPHSQVEPKAFKAEPRTAGVVRAQADAAVAVRHEARRRCPRVRIAEESVARLNPGGRMLLYTGVAIVSGRDPFLGELAPVLDAQGLSWHYRELDVDVFGEELEGSTYAVADRIAAIGMSVTRPAG